MVLNNSNESYLSILFLIVYNESYLFIMYPFEFFNVEIFIKKMLIL